MRRRQAAALVAGVGVLAAAFVGVAHGNAPPTTPATLTAAPSSLPSTVPTLLGPQPLPAVTKVSATTLDIPAIGIHSAALESLLIGSDGALTPPADFRRAGWFSGGPVPGNPGPAVIAGHVDSHDGPAIFLRLSSLRPGDLVTVNRSDGRSVRFRVLTKRTYAKDAFPTSLVYGPTPTASLRLITCGGVYDHQAKRYPDDVVIFAEAV